MNGCDWGDAVQFSSLGLSIASMIDAEITETRPQRNSRVTAMSDAPVQPRSWVRAGPVTPTFFVSDIWTRYVKIFVFVPFLFMLLRNQVFPPRAVELTNLVFEKLVVVWPVLESQQVSIRASLGDDQALWFGAFFVSLFLSLVVPLGRLLLETFRRGHDVMRAQASDALVPIILLFVDPYVLFGDTPRPTLIYDFLPDQWGIFYLRQSLAFSVIAYTLMFVAFYALRLGAMGLALVTVTVHLITPSRAKENDCRRAQPPDFTTSVLEEAGRSKSVSEFR